MKIELDQDQIDLLLDGLDALSEAATAENRASDDVYIHEINDAVIKQTEELYEYLANYRTEVWQ